MKKYFASCFLILLFTGSFINSYGTISLPAIIGNHMVLQQNSTIKIWGWSDPGEKIMITSNWDTIIVNTMGESTAKWTASLKTPAAGGPYTITIKGNNSIQLDDILIGEVWDCSGQSNMEMSFNWGIKEYTKDAEDATNQKIHFFNMPRSTAAYPQDDTKGKWVVCSPDEMKKFSLAGYFFGQQLQQVLKVPVGLINTSWGGTPAEVWTPKEVVENNNILNTAAGKLKPDGHWPTTAGLTYNAMINPIKDYSIAGIIWYQGESNVGTAATYQLLFTNMITAWRKTWNKDLPFYFVQIAPYAGYDSIAGALLREAQTKSLALPNTGMVVITDLVTDIKDIHPHNKKEVGIRLANYALAATYGKTGMAYKSPMYKNMAIEKDKIILNFTDTPNGLISKGGTITDFFIAGADKKFMPATAIIKNNTVVVSNKSIAHPTAVRFGFTSASMPNLFSKEGLPVNNFKTDD